MCMISEMWEMNQQYDKGGKGAVVIFIEEMHKSL